MIATIPAGLKLMVLLVIASPVVVLAAIIWLVHTLWKYRHIPPKS